MNSKMINLIMLVIGAGIGSSLTYFSLKKKYDDLINSAVEEVKQRYSELSEEKVSVEEEEEVSDADAKSKANQQKPNIADYVDYANINKNQGYEPKVEAVSNDVEIITKDEFDNSDYNNAFLTYFADGVLINDLGDDMVDKELVGVHSLETFGDGEDPDIIYVRNNKYEIDYEITRVKDKFNVDEYTESDEVDTDYDD